MIVLGKSPLEKLPPRKFSPIKLPPRKFISEISHPENSYLEYSHPFYCLSSLNISFKTGGRVYMYTLLPGRKILILLERIRFVS